MSLPAQALIDNSYRLVPVHGKRPIWERWVNRWAENAQVFTTAGVTGIGVLLGQGESPIITVDCDCDDETTSREFYQALCNYVNGGAKLPVRIGRWPHWTVPLRTAVVPPRMASIKWFFMDAMAPGRVEIGTHGQQFVAYGVHPGTGKSYRWQHGDLTVLTPMDLPELTSLDEVIGLLDLFDDIARRGGAKELDGRKGTDRGAMVPISALEQEPPLEGVTIEQATKDLAKLEGYDDYDTWLRIGMALHHQFEGGGNALELWNRWSQQSAKYAGAEDIKRRWRSFKSSRGAPVTYASILHALQPEEASSMPDEDAQIMPGVARATDASLADAIAPILEKEYRYDALRDVWRHYIGGRWIEAPEADLFGAIREIITSIVSTMDQPSKEAIKLLRQLESASQPQAIIRELKGRMRMRCIEDDFDVLGIAGLLHFSNGIYDIFECELKPFTPALYKGELTVGRAYNPHATCPTFERIVAEALYDDFAYIDYLHRVVGYALMGRPDEQTMFIALGGGANGKTTIFEAIRYAMGEYATVGRSATLMASADVNGGGPREDLLRLAGKRFVLTEELDDRGTLNEALVKQLTGGAEFTARGLFEKHSRVFHPSWVGVLTANWAPTVRGTDVGIWRRLQVLPFTRNLLTDPQITVDKQLPSKLRDEAQGIMNWLISGAVAYMDRGLGDVPRAVSEATAEYRGKMDLIGQWARDNLVFDSDEHVAEVELYASWSAWATARGVMYVAGNSYKLAQIFRLHFPQVKDDRFGGFHGVRLRG